MSDFIKPIQLNSDLCKTLTSVPEKFIVDFANGIDVARDHLRVQHDRSGFFVRLWDGFTGTSARRQSAINASLIDGVEGSLKWLTQLSKELANSNLSIAKVNYRVTQLTTQICSLIDYSEDTRNQLESLGVELNERIKLLDNNIIRIDFVQKVRINLDQVFDKWEAGRFVGLSPAGNCYAAIEELRYGAFGDYCRMHKGIERDRFLEQAVDRATVQLAKDVEASASSRLSVNDIWLKLPAPVKRNKDWADALAYLANGFSLQDAPLITTIARQLPEGQAGVPLIAGASRIAETVIQEAFLENF